jgi:hypothetical protein
VNARFRVVHFVPDPFSGGRVPIAALVDLGGRVEVAFAESKWEKLLPANARLVARLIRDSLGARASFDGLPASSGPHAVLGEVRSVPTEVTEPLRWVRGAIFGLGEDVSLEQKPVERRQHAGFRLLTSWKVDHWVRRRYRPAEDSNRYAKVLPEISQYVLSKAGLLLMEPVLASQPHFANQLQHIGTSFMAWHHSLEKVKRDSPRPTFYAYVIANGDRDRVAEAHDALKELATVVDVTSAKERDGFISTIKKVGQAAAYVH